MCSTSYHQLMFHEIVEDEPLQFSSLLNCAGINARIIYQLNTGGYKNTEEKFPKIISYATYRVT